MIDLSIVIPTYNRRDRLEKSLNTYLKEKIDNIEIIIVDNHSLDDTEEYVRSLQQKDSRIRYFKNPQNLGYNRNVFRGFLESNADWITILADDDLMEEGYLSELIATIRVNSNSSIIMNALKNEVKLGEYKITKVFDKTTSIKKGKDAIESLYMATGSVPGFTFNKKLINQSDWHLDNTIYPQIRIALFSALNNDILYFVPKNFLVMPKNDTVMTIAKDAMNRPLDFGILERLQILLDVSKKLPKKEREDTIQRLSGSLFAWGSGVFGMMYKEDKEHSFRFLNELVKNKFIKSSSLFWMAFGRTIILNKEILVIDKCRFLFKMSFSLLVSLFKTNFYKSTLYGMKKVLG